MALVVIVPASNEADYIGPCLEAVLASDAASLYVIVSANACRDGTVAKTRSYTQAFADKGHALICLDSDVPGKTAALDRAEAAIPAEFQTTPRAFLDADVVIDPALLGQISAVLDTDMPRYGTGTLAVTRAATWVTRCYARIWVQLPFVTAGTVGAGFFALNAAGRARWGTFPKIISDDTFVRLSFTPAERIEVPARYHWPMIEGLRGLIKVRRRQDAGVAELATVYPQLMGNEAKPALTKGMLAGLALRHPISFGIYMWVHVAVRLKGADTTWSRGR